ncbi:MAG: mechanosensitive ion channel family protein [Halobellus sp.]|uniref:mechanosensitive ion channel family protein n=1 Tax=Halobellus sp. TaxID=1979212 RepID=UPI0035D4DF59
MQPPTTTVAAATTPDGPIGMASSWLQIPGVRPVLALVVVALGVVLSRYVVRLLGRTVARQFTRQSVAQTVLRLVRVAVVLVSLGVAARILGLEVGDLVLSVTVFSAVLGIVLAPIVGSLINGVFVLADQPYEIGDLIELEDGRRAFVDEITINYTKLLTLDNTSLVIPNSSIRDRLVTNYSAEDERVRLRIDVIVTYESDTERARQIMRRAAAAEDEVVEGGPDIRIGGARYPARPTVHRADFGDDGVLLRLRYWAKKPYRIATIESQIRDRIWDAVADADDVEFAYPHRHLVFDDTSGTLDATVDSRAEREIEASAVRRAEEANSPGTVSEPADTQGEGKSSAPNGAPGGDE